MSKAVEENKLTVMVKSLFREFSLYWKFMCISKNNDKNKTSLPTPPFTTVTVLLSAEKLLSL